MTEKKKITEEEHKKLGIDLFNLTWSLLDKKNKTMEEDDKMVHAAHASRFHWGEIGTPLEFERGEWQISRVYSTLKRSESALYHAKRCLELCKENSIGDFDISFAFEAMARGHAIAGNKTSLNPSPSLSDRRSPQPVSVRSRALKAGCNRSWGKLKCRTPSISCSVSSRAPAYVIASASEML